MTTDPTSVHEVFTEHGVRLRRVSAKSGDRDWLLFPGGPGVGSESLFGLADLAELPGATWLVDLPGDGSNLDAPGAPADPYELWPQVLLEAVDAVPSPVAVGHSTGGEYLLSVPELEPRLRGLVLISSAPDSRWMPTFDAMCRAHPLPEVAAAATAYERDPSQARLRDLAVASAPWNFTAAGLEAGRSLLEGLPYNAAAVSWSADNFDRDYVATWWPTSLPTLVVSGSEDRVVDQSLWDDPRFVGRHVQRVVIPDAGHFPWVDQPAPVKACLAGFAATG